jgi:hypothetical protein
MPSKGRLVLARAVFFLAGQWDGAQSRLHTLPGPSPALNGSPYLCKLACAPSRRKHIIEQNIDSVNVYGMSKLPGCNANVPAAVEVALARLGADLATARKRRKQSLREWAARLQVSVPTLMRMERGDAGVSMGVWATATWLIQRHEALAAVADPKEDLAALETAVREAGQRHRQRNEPAAG